MEFTNHNKNNADDINLNGINYYSIEHPETNTFVLAIFNRQDNAFFGVLPEYFGYSCIMNYKDALKKKKVYNWSKFISMDKIQVVQVEDIDISKKIVQVSMAYLADSFTEELNRSELQKKLMQPFTENKRFESFIKSICIINNFDFKNIWKSFVYHIDKLRRKSSDDTYSIPSLYKYFVTNFEDLDKWIEYCKLDESVKIAINKHYQTISKEIPKKIISEIGIISIGGVCETKKLISNVLSQIKYDHSFHYDRTPFYLFESSTKDSDKSSHHKLVEALKTESSKFSPPIFIKSNFIGKISTN